MPELVDWVWFCTLKLSDLVLILNVMFRTCEMLEPLLENGDFFLVGAGFLQLRQCFPGDILEGGAIDPGVIAQRRCRQIQGNASFALDLRKRLELRQGRNIDVKHRSLAPRR